MKYVQLKTVRDLLMLVASAPNASVIQHLENNGSHLYFIVGGTLHEVFLYFVKEKTPLGGNFITYNSYTGQIGSDEKVVHEPNVSSFPVVEIKSQDLLPEELLNKVETL
jgi:hypothetical protein